MSTSSGCKCVGGGDEMEVIKWRHKKMKLSVDSPG